MTHHQHLTSTAGRLAFVATFAACLLALGNPSPVAAQTRYVTDQTEITLRSGQSTRHAIKRMLDSGTRVQVLERDPDSGYVRVTLPDGTDGWVLGRLLMDEPAARDQLAAMRQRVEGFDDVERGLREQITDLEAENATLSANLSNVQGQNATLSTDLEQVRNTSRNALNIASENDVLKARVADNEETIDLLMAENAELKTRATQRWFLIGAGVIVAGIILGLLLPRMRPRRRSSWGSL